MNKGTDAGYSEVDAAEKFARTIVTMEEMGVDEKAVALLRELQKSVLRAYSLSHPVTNLGASRSCNLCKY